jgi:hypothetical protein
LTGNSSEQREFIYYRYWQHDLKITSWFTIMEMG